MKNEANIKEPVNAATPECGSGDHLNTQATPVAVALSESLGDEYGRELSFSEIKSIKDTKPEVGTVTVGALFEALSQHEERDSKFGEAFALLTYHDDKRPRRSNDAVKALEAVIFDVDNATAPQIVEVRKQLKARGINFAAHTTYSYQPDQHRWRFVIPFKAGKSVLAKDWKATFGQMNQDLMMGLADSNTCDAVRHFFFASCPIGALRRIDQNVAGAFLDPTPYVEQGRVQGPPKNVKPGTSNVESGAKGASRKEMQLAISRHFNGHLVYAWDSFHGYDLGGYFKALHGDSEVVTPILDDPDLGNDVLSKANAIVSLMKVRCSVRPELFNPRTDLVCCRNFTLDPLTGKVYPHSPSHRFLSGLPFDWDPTQTAPHWLQFLDEVFRDAPDKASRIMVLQELFGYCLIASTRFQKAFILLGAGANGKSVILDLLECLLGARNVSALSFGELSHRFKVARLQGKLVNITSEISSTAELADGNFKAIVSGDLMEAENKNKDPFMFRPCARLIAATNNLPKTKDHSHGFYRRVVIIKFERTFAKEEQNRDLADELKTELPGILVWAVEGLQRLMAQDGFTESESSVDALEEFKLESDPVRQFAEDCLETIDGKTRSLEIYDAFKRYCTRHGCLTLANSTFGKRLRNVFGEEVAVKSNGPNYYRVRLKDGADKFLSVGTWSDRADNAPPSKRGDLASEFAS